MSEPNYLIGEESNEPTRKREPKPVPLTTHEDAASCFDPAAFVGQVLHLAIGPEFTIESSTSSHVTLRMLHGDTRYPTERLPLCEFWRWVASGIIRLVELPSELETKGTAYEREATRYTRIRRFSVNGRDE